MDENIIKLEISLQRIFFPKNASSVDSGSFAIFMAKVEKVLDGDYDKKKNKSIKLKGNVPTLNYGATYKLTCVLEESNEKYGDTYKILFMNKMIDLGDEYKQKEFLSTILTERQVEELFKTHGDNVISLLDEGNTEELCKVKGITAKKAKRILSIYNDAKDYSDILMELAKLNLTNTFIKKITDHYRNPETAIKVVRENPYKLIEIDGIGFKMADSIALKVGMDKFDIRRVGGYMVHYLQEQGEMGRSYVLYDELLKAVYDTLGFVPEEIMRRVAKTLVEQKTLIVSSDAQKIALNKYYKLETKLAKEIIRLAKGLNDNNNNEICDVDNECVSDINMKTKLETYVPTLKFVDVEERLAEIERGQGFEFTEEQKQAILSIMDNNVVVLTGGAGSGKSSTANGIVNLFDNANIVATALSGKASVRLKEATGLNATTIHRALGYGGGGFEYNKNNKMPCDVVVIDEATMINGSLFLCLLEAIPTGAKVIILGDIQQLTPIGNCQVFNDLLTCGVIKTVKLTKPHRQALRSGIIPLSIEIANNKPIFNNKFTGKQTLGELQDMFLDVHNKDCDLAQLVVEKFKEEMEIYKDVMKVQVCVPMRLRGSLSCYNLNNMIQEVYNPKNEFVDNEDCIRILMEKGTDEDDRREYVLRVNDKVVNTVNNYNTISTDGIKTPIYNGNIGCITSISSDGIVTIDFEGIGEVILDKNESKNLELAYAMTTHKLQGSGFDSVIVAMDGSSFIMNNAEQLYTAITRAKKRCTLVGDTTAIRKAILTKEVNKKQTFLCDFLNYLFAEETK